MAAVGPGGRSDRIGKVTCLTDRGAGRQGVQRRARLAEARSRACGMTPRPLFVRRAEQRSLGFIMNLPHFEGWHLIGAFPDGVPDDVGSWLLVHGGEAMLLEVPPGLTVRAVR